MDLLTTFLKNDNIKAIVWYPMRAILGNVHWTTEFFMVYSLRSWTKMCSVYSFALSRLLQKQKRIAKNVPHIWYNIDIIFFKKKTKILVFNDANNKVWNLYSKSCLFFSFCFLRKFLFQKSGRKFFQNFQKIHFFIFSKARGDLTPPK